jgi:uracil-DNA glycosylase family 4
MMGLRLHDAFIAARVRAAPPENKPTPEKFATCQPHLEAEIARAPRVRVVVALGRIAFDAYLRLAGNNRRRVGRRGRRSAHNVNHQLPIGSRYSACYHPQPAETIRQADGVTLMDEVLRSSKSTVYS